MIKNLTKLLLFILLLVSCTSKTITINNHTENIVTQKAENELTHYLPIIYKDIKVEKTDKNQLSDINLIFSNQLSEFGLSDVTIPASAESYQVVESEGKLYIIANDEKGLLFATYALLEELGCGFYLTKESLPSAKEWDGFDGINLKDSPVVSKRFLFNWHNFISGCTGWNLENWKEWIDGASKMRYNGVMIHAYGNNPMFSFDYMGETKTTGYINNSASGRDWGNQHIDDVRRMVGGEMFDSAVYGAKPSFATEENKVEEATELIQQVFSYCDSCGVDIAFALDLDTWMSNPQNIIEKMPKESVLNIRGYLAPNPDSKEGYKYYKHLLKTFIKTYPEVDELTAWSRGSNNKYNSNLGTIWMAYAYEDFPNEWKKEFNSILKQNKELKKDLYASGSFAFSKIIKTLQKAAKELGSDIVIGYGSWNFEWMQVMDVFIPKDVPFRPLDATILFENEKYDSLMASVAQNRDVYPIVWAHHDDFSYLGRPYEPFKNLTEIINKRHLNGLGIIHWTTHPLDLYFKGTALQLWENSANIEYKKVVDKFVAGMFGESSPEISQYYNEWAVNAPMFGRETSDHVIDLGHIHWKSTIKDWASLIEPTEKRIALIEKTPKELRNNYWKYQRTMEDFYLSFFKNQDRFAKAYAFLEDKDVDKAREVLKDANPKATIEKYVEALKYIPTTAGEKAIIISLNSRWMVDFDNIKQRVGLQEVLTTFAPTYHDPLAQMPGVNSYNVDKDGNWWIKYWEKELPNNNFKMIGDIGVMYGKDFVNLPLTTMHKNLLPKGKHTLTIQTNTLKNVSCSIIENNKTIASKKFNSGEEIAIDFVSSGNSLELEIKTDGEIELYSYRIE